MKKRTNLEKTLLSLSSLLLLTLLLMILFGIAYHGKKADAPSEDDGSCWSDECIETAGGILSSMDFGTDPCSNFYGFACGKYGREPEQSISTPKRSINSVYFALKNLMESRENLNINGLEDARNFYSSCVTFGNSMQKPDAVAEALRDLMNDVGLGTWPIIDPLYETAGFSLERTLASLILLDVPVAFQMDIVSDESIPGALLVKIYPGGPRESGRSQSDIRSDAHLKSSVLTSMLLLGAQSHDTDVIDILTVDSMFARLDQENTECDVMQLPPQQALAELKRLMPEIKWTIILSEIRNATGLVRPFGVELHCKKKIRDYVVYLNDLIERSVMNYLGWRFFSKFEEHVIPTSLKFPYGADEVMVPRWRVCLELMEKFSSPLLAEALTRKTISKEVKSEVQKISQSILSTTRQLVSGARWLTEQQQSRIREKVARIRIRYPFRTRNSSSAEASVHIPRVNVSNFTVVVIHLQRRWVIQNFKKLDLEERRSEDPDVGVPLTSTSFGSSPRDLSVAVYIDTILGPFFRLQGSEWMNYGGIGVFLARELTKVVMSLNIGGSSHDPSGGLWNLFTGHSDTSTCLLRTLTARLGIRGQDLTQEQLQNVTRRIFLDRSAAEIAYRSASTAASSSRSISLPGLQDLSKEKMFFLSHAQTLCAVASSFNSSLNIPLNERFNSAVSSFKTFHEVFSCASPSPQCQIWA